MTVNRITAFDCSGNSVSRYGQKNKQSLVCSEGNVYQLIYRSTTCAFGLRSIDTSVGFLVKTCARFVLTRIIFGPGITNNFQFGDDFSLVGDHLQSCTTPSPNVYLRIYVFSFSILRQNHRLQLSGIDNCFSFKKWMTVLKLP